MAYQPKKFEITSLELIGYRQPDGSIRLGNPSGTWFPSFPLEVEVEGLTYTLEDTKVNREMFDLTPDHAGFTVEWGVYV